MSWNIGTIADPDGVVHIWYLQTLGSFEEDMLVCKGGISGFIPMEKVNKQGGWVYCEARVTCEKCKGDR